MDWRVLIVDDQASKDIEEFIGGRKTVKNPDSISCVLCEKFPQAIDLLKKERFDLVILDLKDDAAPEAEVLAGEKVFEELMLCRFVPVIFHTGYPQKVADLVSPYVKVVTRAEWEALRSAINEVFDTKLPSLIRHIEEEQRKFMWESAKKIWTGDLHKSSSTDLVYLLARRLANSLSGDMVRSFLAVDAAGGAPKVDKIHAVELYIYPPLSKDYLFGDVFKRIAGGNTEYFVALTPSCDHAQKKVDFILLAKCVALLDTEAGKNAANSVAAGEALSGSTAEKLSKYIKDNSSPVDRFKYLPGTSFLPDLLVDLQHIKNFTPNEFHSGAEGFERIASLDSPFAESLQAKMARYLGRMGTPDIDADLALERFKLRIKTP